MTEPTKIPLYVGCQRCGVAMVVPEEEAELWKPGMTAAHAPGQCPREIAEQQASLGRKLRYELDLVLRILPEADVTEQETHDDRVEASEVLARTTRGVVAVSGPDALGKMLPLTDEMWKQIVALAPIADAGYREELVAQTADQEWEPPTHPGSDPARRKS